MAAGDLAEVFSENTTKPHALLHDHLRKGLHNGPSRYIMDLAVVVWLHNRPASCCPLNCIFNGATGCITV